MANAAIHFDREPYDAALPRPMGRHAAGEGFLRGFLHHADVDRIHLWNAHGRPVDDFAPLLSRLGPPRVPVNWIAAADRAGLGAAGALHLPSPDIADQAWARRAVGATRYSITAVTHTIAETYILDQIANLLIAPVEPWDALVCTSAAVRAAVETQLAAVADHLQDRLGVTRLPPAQLVTIPLGVHADDFTHDDDARAAWRAALDIPADAVVALHVGRFSVNTKMHPGPMGLALQEAAARSDRTVFWLLAGGSPSGAADAEFRAAAAALCPDVQLRFLGDTAFDAHGLVWSAADVFLSFSDNVQESFGLTVAEAMAAGLPCVISDWDGYRDTVRHGVDGFRIRTTAPRPGLGADLIYRYAHGLSGYEAYAGAAAQFVAVDIAAAADALAALFNDAGLRARIGAAGQARARADLDWSAVIPQYQALWAELERRRQGAAVQPPRPSGGNPWRLDPFTMFAAHPTHALAPSDEVSLPRALTPADIDQRLAAQGVRHAGARLPTVAETQALIAALSPDRGVAVAVVLERFAPERRPFLERGLIWLAKYGLVKLSGPPAG